MVQSLSMDNLHQTGMGSGRRWANPQMTPLQVRLGIPMELLVGTLLEVEVGAGVGAGVGGDLGVGAEMEVEVEGIGVVEAE